MTNLGFLWTSPPGDGLAQGALSLPRRTASASTSPCPFEDVPSPSPTAAPAPPSTAHSATSSPPTDQQGCYQMSGTPSPPSRRRPWAPPRVSWCRAAPSRPRNRAVAAARLRQARRPCRCPGARRAGRTSSGLPTSGLGKDSAWPHPERRSSTQAARRRDGSARRRGPGGFAPMRGRAALPAGEARVRSGVIRRRAERGRRGAVVSRTRGRRRSDGSGYHRLLAVQGRPRWGLGVGSPRLYQARTRGDRGTQRHREPTLTAALDWALARAPCPRRRAGGLDWRLQGHTDAEQRHVADRPQQRHLHLAVPAPAPARARWPRAGAGPVLLVAVVSTDARLAEQPAVLGG